MYIGACSHWHQLALAWVSIDTSWHWDRNEPLVLALVVELEQVVIKLVVMVVLIEVT